MRETKHLDYFLLVILALIWASAFFNIKIATYSYGPLTIAFLRIFFGAIPVILLCHFKKIIPEKPIKTPMNLIKLIFSFLVKKCASAAALKGVLAIKIAAKLLCTF